jgi:phosphoadenosine phosphosulfate reductase
MPPLDGAEGSSPQQSAEATIWRHGEFHRDTWITAVDAEPLPDEPAIVSKPRWLAERNALGSHHAPLALLLAAGESIDDIAADVHRFAMIALDFPKFSDGRAFSTARLLREKHDYRGEMRAVGNVLADQIPLMWRVGFDSLKVTHAPTRHALLEGRLARVILHYQPAALSEAPAGRRPWLRRSS